MKIGQKDCTGCGVCCARCPVHAIEMVENSEGFFYPRIDESRCIHCGLCERVCHLHAPATQPTQVAYAARARDHDMLLRSTSGGIFGVLATSILQQQGVVFGCAFDEQMVPRHIMVTELAALHRLQGSKYVESDLGDSFAQAQTALNAGKTVLFTGTGCQIAALKAYLGKDYPTLYTADVICHGVPSRRFFAEHLRRKGAGITDYQFRAKEDGRWGDYHYAYWQNGKRVHGDITEDYYYTSFLCSMCSRESCYMCQYATVCREGDISMGDFWGIEKLHPAFQASQGASLLLINTERGEKLLEDNRDKLIMERTSLSEVFAYQGHLQKAAVRPAKRDHFYEGVQAGRLGWTIRAWRVKARIKQMCPALANLGLRKKR